MHFSNTVVVTDEVGLHLRTAAILAQESQKYNCDISLIFEGKKANCKSLFEILALGVKCGSTVRLSVCGDQAELAINHLTKLIESDFDLASVSEDQISK